MRPIFWTALCAALMCAPAHAGLVDNFDGTVTDDSTGLMWTQDANLALTLNFQPPGREVDEGAMDWTQANLFIDHLNAIDYGGYADWRLPSLIGQDVSELSQLWLETNYTGNYWLADIFQDDPIFGTTVWYFGGGGHDTSHREDGGWISVWAVRDTVSVPVPGTLGLLLLGLASVALLGKRYPSG